MSEGEVPLAAGYSPVIDAHAHLGVQWMMADVYVTVADAIAMMDRCGIEKVCSSASAYLKFDFREGNRVTLAVVREYSDRVLGFVIADPRRARESAEELDRYLNDEGFVGAKLHVSHTTVPYDDPRYDPIYERIAESGVPVLAHTFSAVAVRTFLASARRFPEVPFIVGHSGGYDWPLILQDVAAVPNAYFDVCCSCPDAGRVEAFVAAGGAERVLFGTDLPFLAAANDLSQVVHAQLSKAEKALILGGNITRILGDRL